MDHNSMINYKVQIREVYCTINLEMKYFCNQKGQVIGIKNLNKKRYIYLIEFFNYSRVWAIKREFKIIQD